MNETIEKRPSTEPQLTGNPETASDHNNSIITAVSADRDSREKSSPATSPFIYRKNDDKNHESVELRFENVVNGKSKELVSLMKEIVELIDLKDDDNQLEKFVNEQEKSIKDKKFDWKKLVDLSESIFNDYSKEMENITKDFEELNKVWIIPFPSNRFFY